LKTLFNFATKHLLKVLHPNILIHTAKLAFTACGIVAHFGVPTGVSDAVLASSEMADTVRHALDFVV
jgi:hypothetical protein